MVFIAAELGVNWRNLTEAKRMMGLAEFAGADGIKFQMFREEHIKGHPREEELQNLILDQQDIYYLKSMAVQCGIEFFATPMYPEAVDMLEAVEVNRYKIRYSDRNNIDLINKIISTGKPYLISCDDEYIYKSAPQEVWNEEPAKRTFVFCVPKYPPETVQLPYTFHEYVSLFRGYSNHYPSIAVPLAAAARGAEYVEVHVKNDKYRDGFTTIDDAVSITFSELKDLVKFTREIEKVII